MSIHVRSGNSCSVFCTSEAKPGGMPRAERKASWSAVGDVGYCALCLAGEDALAQEITGEEDASAAGKRHKSEFEKQLRSQLDGLLVGGAEEQISQWDANVPPAPQDLVDLSVEAMDLMELTLSSGGDRGGRDLGGGGGRLTAAPSAAAIALRFGLLHLHQLGSAARHRWRR